jgi:hypothetical protein
MQLNRLFQSLGTNKVTATFIPVERFTEDYPPRPPPMFPEIAWNPVAPGADASPAHPAAEPVALAPTFDQQILRDIELASDEDALYAAVRMAVKMLHRAVVVFARADAKRGCAGGTETYDGAIALESDGTWHDDSTSSALARFARQVVGDGAVDAMSVSRLREALRLMGVRRSRAGKPLDKAQMAELVARAVIGAGVRDAATDEAIVAPDAV